MNPSSSSNHNHENGKIQHIKWRDLKVGNCVQILNREVIPADVLILAVAESNVSNPGGICYVETKSLDGETNLKLRQAMENTMSISDLNGVHGVVECEVPNPYLDKFAGSLVVKSQVESDEPSKYEENKEPITSKNVLLRGCVLRNTDWVVGLVLNTGLCCVCI